MARRFYKMSLPKILRNTCNFVGGNNIFLRGITTNEITKVERTLNQVTLLGRVGGEPQKRGSELHPVIVFSIATHLNYKYEGGDYVQKTDWHRICVFKPALRETVYNYLKKGQRVMINGRLSYGEMKSEEGTMKSTTSVIADEVIFFQ